MSSTRAADAPVVGRGAVASWALLALVLLVPSASIGTLAGLRWWPGTWLGQGLYGLGKAWLLLLPLAWLTWVERKPWGFSPLRHGGLRAGALLGLAMGAAIIGGYFALRGSIDPGAMRSLVARNHLNNPAMYLGFAALTTTINALLEEYVWRWFVVRRWEEVTGQGVAAALLAAACFTIHHVVVLALYFGPGVVALGSLGVFVGGAVWSALYVRYRSIWPGYICHGLADVAIFWVGWQLIFG